jgi:hypothetical protein
MQVLIKYRYVILLFLGMFFMAYNGRTQIIM